MADEDVYELKREGHRTSQLRGANLTITNIGAVFGLDPKSIWLKDVTGSRCFFPVEDRFDISNYCYTLIVEGTPPRRLSTALSVSASQEGASSSSSSMSHRLKSNSSCTVKIVKASKSITPSGKIEMNSMGDTFYLSLISSTANIKYIESEVKARWGDDFIVVANDGLQFGDSPATRGISFWKCGSRKLFAVEKESKKLGKGKKRERHYSDSDEDSPLKYSTAMMYQLDNISSKVSKVLEVNRHLPLPVGLASIIHETFKCSVCLNSPIRPPVIFGRCCGKIIGCQKCVDRWYKGDSGLEKRCPLCNKERGVAESMKLMGLDEFLTAVRESGLLVDPPSTGTAGETSYVPAPPQEILSDFSDD